MKNIIVTLTLVCVSVFTFAQDRIIKTDLKEILCKVTEIGVTEIKYKKAENLDGPTYTIKKSEVKKIIFENGTEEIMEQSALTIVPAKNRNFKRAITTRPFSPLFNHLSLGYQQALSASRAFIAEVGLIGKGVGDGREDVTGAYGRIGFRLKRTPEVVMEGMEWGYNLAGVYLQPEITYSSFSSSGGGVFTNSGSFISSAFLLTLGKQMIVGDIVTFDWSGSFGYEIYNDYKTSDPDDLLQQLSGRSRYYSHTTFPTSPFAFKFSITMGILLK